MAKLHPDALAEGRQFLVDDDLDGFCAWHEAHFRFREIKPIRRDFRIFLKAEPKYALKLFDKYYPNEDPMVDNVKVGIYGFTFVMSILLGLGLVGAGLWWLIS